MKKNLKIGVPFFYFKHRFFLLFLGIVAFSFYCTAQKPYSLKITDNTTKEKITYNYKSSFSSINERQKEINAVFHHFYTNGFLAFSADSIVTDSLHKSLYVHKGKQYKWALINTSAVNQNIISLSKVRFNEFAEKPVSIDAVKKEMNKMLSYLENNGYPFARIYLNNIRADEDNFKANLFLEKNTKILIEEIQIKGNATASTSFIKKHLALYEGNLYNEEKIKKIDKKLNDLVFLNITENTKVIFFDSTCVISIYADKKNANNFDGILGIMPDELTGKIVLTGDVKLKLNNAFNHAEELEANWKRFHENSQKLFIGFSVPYIFNTPFGIDYSIDLLRKDTTYITINQKPGLRYHLGGFDFIRFYGDFRHSYLLSEPLNNNIMPNYSDVRIILWGAAWYKENFDNRITPTKGFGFNAGIAGGNKKITPPPQIAPEVYKDIELKTKQYRLDVKTDFFVMPIKRSVIMCQTIGGYLSGNNFFENELYRIGGLKTLKGFDEESIYASQYAILNVEYRYMLDRNSFINIFWNGAYYEKNAINNRIIDRPYGFGAGLTFESRQGIFSIFYALGKQFDNPVMFKNAKIHFGIVNSF